MIFGDYNPGGKLAITVPRSVGQLPDYYYQKQFFSGRDNPLSKPDSLMHYDLEVSGFPSSHAGHIVLLKLKDQDYRSYSWGVVVSVPLTFTTERGRYRAEPARAADGSAYRAP